MRLLLDTHVAIWSVTALHRIPPHVREIIRDPRSSVYVSTVSMWEIGIKNTQSRRDPVPYSSRTAATHFAEAGYEIIPLTPEHSFEFEDVAMHHTDPFDRMLVAQARCESLRLLTHDAKLAAYGDPVMSF